MVSEIYDYLYWCILFGVAPCCAKSLDAYLRMEDYRTEKERKEDQ